jgi:hypothetical protein
MPSCFVDGEATKYDDIRWVVDVNLARIIQVKKTHYFALA